MNKQISVSDLAMKRMLPTYLMLNEECVSQGSPSTTIMRRHRQRKEWSSG